MHTNAVETYADKTGGNSGKINYKFSYTDMVENTEENDDNYLAEDKFDINKYKYLYANNYGENQDQTQNSNDEYEN